MICVAIKRTMLGVIMPSFVVKKWTFRMKKLHFGDKKVLVY
jgi:hypothetical protein